MLDEFRRVALFTSGVVELTKHRAEQIVKGLVQSGEVRRDKAAGTVLELLSFAKENRREVLAMLKGEIENQVESLGLARKRDLERLERRITRLEDRSSSSSRSDSGGGSSSRPATPSRKSTAKKATATKSTAKKSTAKKSTAKKATANKTTKTTAKKTTAPKADASSTPASGGSQTSGS
jgi:polyhydroxyalkanoate synthesis regulator phasin